MTLSRKTQIVKRPRPQWVNGAWRGLAALLAGAGAAVLLIDWELRAQAQARMDRFGAGMANMMAELALPHVVQPRRLELEGLAKRVVELDAVESLSFHTVDGRTLAFATRGANPSHTKAYPASVTVGDSLAGFARVVLNADRFKPATVALIAGLWPIWAVAMAVVLALAFHRAWPARPRRESATGPADAPPPDTARAAYPSAATDGRPAEARHAPSPAHGRTAPGPAQAEVPGSVTGANATAPGHDPAAQPEPPTPTPEDARAAPPGPAATAAGPQGPALALVVSLFNADGLPPNRRAEAVRDALRAASDVAKAHGGHAQGLVGRGAFIRFPAAQGFEAAVAGLDLAQRIAAAERDGALFRCALHPLEDTDDDATAPALSLAALAPPRLLAVSATALSAIAEPGRFRTTAIPERTVTALAAANLGACHVLHGLKGPAAPPPATG